MMKEVSLHNLEFAKSHLKAKKSSFVRQFFLIYIIISINFKALLY